MGRQWDGRVQLFFFFFWGVGGSEQWETVGGYGSAMLTAGSNTGATDSSLGGTTMSSGHGASTVASQVCISYPGSESAGSGIWARSSRSCVWRSTSRWAVSA